MEDGFELKLQEDFPFMKQSKVKEQNAALGKNKCTTY